MISGEMSAEFIYKDEDVVAFRDINPIAPVHILIIPRRHIASINDLKEGDERLVGRMIMAAKGIAKKMEIANDGYKLLFRTGEYGGQEVLHIHLHLIGGAKLSEDIRPE